MTKHRGCYWCKYRKELICYESGITVNLNITLKAHAQPLVELSLRDYVINETSIQNGRINGRIGCNCNCFKRGKLLTKERVVFT